ncbi:hypothetical protein [Streptomyces anulatus]|nr:hypothetical protein [Streptomyces anulatus]
MGGNSVKDQLGSGERASGRLICDGNTRPAGGFGRDDRRGVP